MYELAMQIHLHWYGTPIFSVVISKYLNDLEEAN